MAEGREKRKVIMQDFPSQVDINQPIKNFLLLKNQKVYYYVQKCPPWTLF
jgi:hypothetical protein